MGIIFATAYSNHISVGLDFPEPGMTKQAHKDESDINQIMAKYQRTGILAHAKNYSGEYGFATSDSFHDSLNIIQKAQNMFDALPSAIRTKFQNDPSQFLNFVQDPENAQELYDLGLSDIPPERPVETSETSNGPIEPSAPPEAPPAP